MRKRRTIALSAAIAVGALGTISVTGTPSSAAPKTTAKAAAGCGRVANNKASAPGITKNSVTVALVTSLTGPASSTFVDTGDGVKARFELENSKGGVCGRKLNFVSIDDTSNPSAMTTALQQAVEQRKAFAVIGYTAFLYGGFRYTVDNKVPVLGAAFDGPEWGIPGNENLFSYVPLDPGYPADTLQGQYYKSLGLTNVAGVAYGNSPSSTASIKQMAASVKAAGLKADYLNLSFPFGGTDFTATILEAQKAGADAIICSCVQSSVSAMATAVKQAGAKMTVIGYTGYDQNTLENPTVKAAAQGAYFRVGIVPYELGEPAGKTLLDSLKTYAGDKGGIPSFGKQGGYTTADLFIAGLKAAGQNPTRASYMKSLRAVKGYDAGGLLPSKIDLADFGKFPKEVCSYFVKLEGDKFIPQPKACGTVIPNSNQA